MPERSRQSAWSLTVLGMAWLGLFPLWQDGSYAHITRAKWHGMLALTAVTVLVFAGTLVFRLVCRRTRPHCRWTAAHAFAVLYFALVAGSARWGSAAASVNADGLPTVLFGAQRYEGLYTQLCYAAIFLCLSVYPANLRRVLDAAALALLVYCGVVAAQYADINVLGLFPTGFSIRTNYEFQGTIGNIDMVSGYIALVVPALFLAFVRRTRGGWHWALAGWAGMLLMLCMEVQSGLIALGVMVLGLVVQALHRPETRCRTALTLGVGLMLVSCRLCLGLPWLDGTDCVSFPHEPAAVKLLPALLGQMFCLAAVLLRLCPGRAWSWRGVALLLLALAVMLLAIMWFAPFPTGSGLWEMQEVLHGRPQDRFGSERLGIWRLSLELSRAHPLWGTGPDTFLYAMSDHMRQTGQTLSQRFDTPHNMLLAILTNNGLPAMVAFIVLGCVVLRRTGSAPLALGCLCYLIQGLFSFSICLVTPMFWCALGLQVPRGLPPSSADADATSLGEGGLAGPCPKRLPPRGSCQR